MNFFEAVFSFVFGDGDPNAEFERRRWALAAPRSSRGALAAEQPRRFSTAEKSRSAPRTRASCSPR